MSRTRHVWVRLPNQPTQVAGLVLDWRKAGDDAWEALTTYVEPQGRVITEWVPVSRLVPVQEAPPFTGSAYG